MMEQNPAQQLLHRMLHSQDFVGMRISAALIVAVVDKLAKGISISGPEMASAIGEFCLRAGREFSENNPEHTLAVSIQVMASVLEERLANK